MGMSAASSLCIRIDPRARGELQVQIYEAIRRAILDGVIKPGARLQSSRALADDLGVSRTTTLLAIEQLTSEGYLTARRGSGTFVAQELPDDLARVMTRTRVARTARTAAATPAPPTAATAAANAATTGAAAQRRPPQSHPPLSRRGMALADAPPNARRVGGPPRPFRIGIPGLDLFPIRLWTQLVTRRLKAVTLSQLDYSDPAGLIALREAIADHVRTARGTRCTADQVIVTAGAQGALDLICRVLLDPGDTALLEDPGYTGARSAMLAAGARVLPVRVDADGLDVDVLVRHEPARLVFVTPSHQFPLGVPMSLARRLALLRWAAAASAWVVEDDYDSEFRHNARPLPCLHGLDVDGRVIYIGSFSKSVFPALRLGFLIVPPDLHQPLLAARGAVDIHPQGLDQAVLADFMSAGHFDRHLRRMRAAYRERAEALTEAVERVCGGVMHLRPVRTGLHAVADLDHEVDADRVFVEAKERGVEVMSLSAYSLRRPRAGGLNGLVLGFASMPPEALRKGVERLATAIDAARLPVSAPAVTRLATARRA